MNTAVNVHVFMNEWACTLPHHFLTVRHAGELDAHALAQKHPPTQAKANCTLKCVHVCVCVL